MNIGITKKLIDKLKIKVDKGEETSDIFTWSANLITLNRKNTVVVVNDYSRYGFVLSGLKVKDFNNLDSLIIEGIKTSLKRLQIKEDIINKYIELAGDINFTKTKGPKYVSRLNQACEICHIVDDLLDSDNMYQREISKKINWQSVKFDNNYEETPKRMEEAFKDLFKEEIIECEAAELEITLDLGVYKAKRTIVTPINITFDDLHKIIQKVYSWQDYHLHEFLIHDLDGKLALNLITQAEEDTVNSTVPIKYQTDVLISDYVKAGNKIIYHYDYGDDWNHIIKVKKIIDKYNDNKAVCIDAVGDAPPEDVGGKYGFMDFYKIISDKEHPQYQEFYIWAIGNGYTTLNRKIINISLESALL